MMTDESAKVALVTGAAKRLGAEIVRSLHRAGYNVVLHYRASEAEAQHVAGELNALRAESVFILQADLMDLSQVRNLAALVVQQWGRLDLLVNNASLFYPTPWGQVGENDWNCLMDSNLKAPFFLAQYLSADLIRYKGCIINLVDIHAEKGLLDYSVYSIAKAGLVAMTHCLAKEFAPEVRVNAVAPGAILWPEHEVSLDRQADILRKVALQRCGTPEDIAKAVLFLAEEAGYMTGQVLSVDGGRTLFT